MGRRDGIAGINERWRDFAAEQLGPEHDRHRDDVQATFYAGASAVYNMVRELTVAGADETEWVAEMIRLQIDLNIFINRSNARRKTTNRPGEK